ncbi:DNA polymerase III subunit chi [Frischella perrara]|uniref:DNA polymerase III, chi subunit n=2 Tax=Frischella perrara TaxID=1267021 RepID=A0A0A7S2E9_FRIPE|nr:DNA polymerase III subunit chi [Frischella perrara]AJA45002.1 DNA polymerase III, chi subunit [Frischella perrara]PWV58669.1 DNA polymerase III chi subunit [Frischella perrara]
MLKKVIFYLIENAKKFSIDNALLPHEKLACEQIILNWQQGLRILVACQNQEQAERIDEYLWQLSPESFVPHNLVGEGLTNGSPVEIAWVGKKGNGNRQLLVNLQEQFPEFSPAYNDIIDFVPPDENLKALARERYLTYKSMGFNIKTIKVSGG